jgi:hypothetical protein
VRLGKPHHQPTRCAARHGWCCCGYSGAIRLVCVVFTATVDVAILVI